MHHNTKSHPLTLKPKYPDLSKFRYSQRPIRQSPDLSLYNYTNDQSPLKYNKVQKFFNQNSASVSKSTIIKSSETVTFLPTWEINERLDSFQMRISKPCFHSLDSLSQDYQLWEKTLHDISKIISHSFNEFSELISSLHSQERRFFKGLIEIHKTMKEKNKKRVKELKARIVDYVGKLAEITEKVKDNDRIQADVDMRIDKEIKDIFGGDSIDVDSLREKVKKIKERDSAPAADFLKDVLEQLSREQMIPEHKTQLPASLDMTEYQNVLNDKFKTLQESTALRVARLFGSKENTGDKACQTHEIFIELLEFQENKEALDKAVLQVQTITAVTEKVKKNNSELELKIAALVDEKSKLSTENILKNTEIQSLLEKEKIYKEKIQNLRREMLQGYPGSPYIKERIDDQDKAPKYLAPGSRISSPLLNLSPTRIERKPTVKEDTVSLQKVEIKENLKPVSRSSYYSSMYSKASEQGYSEYEEEKEKIESEYENSVIGLEEGLTPSFNESVLNEKSFALATNDLSSQISKARIEDKNVNLKISIHPESNITASIEDKSVKFQEGDKNINLIKQQVQSRETKKLSISPSKIEDMKSSIEQNLPIKIPESSKINENTQINDKVRIDEKIQVTEKTQTTGRTTGKSQTNYNPPVNSSKPKTKPQAISNTLTSPLIPGDYQKASNNTEKSFLLKNDSTSKEPSDLPDKFLERPKKSKLLPQRQIFKNLKVSVPRKTLKPSIEMNDKSLSIEEEKIHIENTQPLPETSSVKKKMNPRLVDASVITGSDLPKFDSKEIGTQFGPEVPHNTKESGVYIIPFNPNNIYGLKGDKYFHTSKSIFSAQPQIPDLKDSHLFLPAFH